MSIIGFVIIMLSLAGIGAVFMWLRQRAALPAPQLQPAYRPPGIDTARLLDNFEQRFAELKGRRPSEKVFDDLYALADQLEKRGRMTQATAVFRHLARTDGSYRDAAVRLARLLDAEFRAGATPAPQARPVARPGQAPTPQSAGETMPIGAMPSRAQAEAGKGQVERLGRYDLQKEIGRG